MVKTDKKKIIKELNNIFNKIKEKLLKTKKTSQNETFKIKFIFLKD